MKNMRKKSVAVLAGLAIAGLVGAAAASLNGIEAEGLGAEQTVVAGCDGDGIEIAFTTVFNTVTDEYDVNGVTVSDIDVACDGQTLELTLSAGGAGVASGTLVVDATSETIAIAPTTSAEAVDAVAVVISG